MELRPASGADQPFVDELDGALVTEQLGLGGWEAEVRAPVVALQLAARRRDRAERFPRADRLVILRAGGPVGALTVDRSSDRLLIVDLAVIPAARRQGIAAAAVGALAAEADQAGLPILVTVHTGNRPSRRLFVEAGFRELADDGVNVRLDRPPAPAGLSL